MALLERLLERRASVVSAHPRDPALAELWGIPNSATGVHVTADTALQYSAISRCVKLLSESVAQLPLFVYRRSDNGGKEPAPNHPLFRKLHLKPNRDQTAFEFREMVQGHLELRGNAYVQRVVTNGGELAELVPLHPDRMRAEMTETQEIRYEYQRSSGGPRTFRPEDIWHLRGFSTGGLLGLDPILYHRETIGLGMAMEEFGARFFGNSVTPTGVLEHPAKLGDKAHEHLRQDVRERAGGLRKAHGFMILEEGMKWHQMGLTAEQSQFLGSRRFQLSEVARIFGVPLHMLQDPERGETFASAEVKALEFVIYTLLSRLKRFEQSATTVLLSEAEQAEFFLEFQLAGLLRGATQERYNAYAIGRQWGWLSVNDIRRLENMNPIAGGDVYLTPLNMVETGSTEKDMRAAFATEVRQILEVTGRPPESREERAARALGARRRLQRAYRPIFVDAAGRVMNREIKALEQAIKTHLRKRSAADFDRTLEEFYRPGGDHAQFVARTMLPAVRSLAEAIQHEAALEVGGQQTFSPAMERFVSDYVGTLARRHVDSSRGQLQAILEESPADTAPSLLQERLDEWGETRSEKIADRETVKASGAVARETWRSTGVQRMKWVSSADSCNLCQSFDGRTVAIDGAFAREGDTVDNPGGAPLKVSGIRAHPPLHGGCDCSITPA